MKISCSHHVWAMLGVLLLTTVVDVRSAVAQNRGQRGQRGGGGRNLPAVGKELPDVSVLDENGKAMQLRSISGEGKYAVVVFGCLT